MLITDEQFKAPQERGGSHGKRAVRLIRVFVRRTSATPDDALAFVGMPPLGSPDLQGVDEVHISCVFSWDRAAAMRLFSEWSVYFPGRVKFGGPAFDSFGGEFVPGRYVKKGLVITTRGCPNKCSWCFVPEREGKLRTVPITAGYNVMDNNLLAAPMDHLFGVFDMLRRQKRAAEFTGGLDASLLNMEHLELLKSIRVRRIFLAYDHPFQTEDIERAAAMLKEAGFDREKMWCYVLVGNNRDTLAKAENRCRMVWKLGFMPFAMLYQPAGDKKETYHKLWRDFTRNWTRPAIIKARMRRRSSLRQI